MVAGPPLASEPRPGPEEAAVCNWALDFLEPGYPLTQGPHFTLNRGLGLGQHPASECSSPVLLVTCLPASSLTQDTHQGNLASLSHGWLGGLIVLAPLLTTPLPGPGGEPGPALLLALPTVLPGARAVSSCDSHAFPGWTWEPRVRAVPTACPQLRPTRPHGLSPLLRDPP